jgi:hypothetical protein
MLNKIISRIKKSKSKTIRHIETNDDIDSLKILLAKSLISTNNNLQSNNIHDFEFKVFSQWGDDGIIQYLIKKISVPQKTFIEFGVENYSESNTRFLLLNNNWSGFIMDGSEDHIKYIKRQNYYWRYDITATCSFITAENINDLLKQSSFEKDVGIYHIDIDGNDYWVWKATTIINPIIVIVEYQSLFGCGRPITTIYDQDFLRTEAHYSNLLYGSSLLSLCDLAEEKGYFFIGCNSSGNNAYFIRKDRIGTLRPLSAKEGYVLSKFREARNENGDLTFLNGTNRNNLIKGMEVLNTRSNKTEIF